MPLLSHPDRTLEQHLNGCNQLAKAILTQKTPTSLFYHFEVLDELLELLIWFHDLGKATAYFQYRIANAAQTEQAPMFVQYPQYINAIQQDKKAIEDALRIKPALGYHAALGAYLLTAHYQPTDHILKLIALQCVKKHHGNLPDYEEFVFVIDEKELKIYQQQINKLDFTRLDNLLSKHGFTLQQSQWKTITNTYTDDLEMLEQLEPLEKCQHLRYFVLQQFLFSVLLSADKGDLMLDNKQLIHANQKIPTTAVDAFKQDQFGNATPKTIDLLREEAYQQIAKNIVEHHQQCFFSITLPTGMGKTFSAYNAAIQLQNSLPQTRRIIYCLPFTSIIDQNESILNDILAFTNPQLTNLVGKHHYLAAFKEDYGEDSINSKEGEYLTEGWEQDIMVTTFVQLLESIFTNKNRQLRKFHNLTDAIILLDEVQNIPPKLYPLIAQTFEALATYFGTRFIFITATQPILLHPSKIIELTDPTRQQTQYYFEQLDRIELHKHWLAEGILEVTDLVDKIAFDMETSATKSVLVICNTIKQSQEVFEQLSKVSGIDVDNCYYLSSSLLPYQRKEVIAAIKKNTKNRKRQLLVTTQVVEAGVDIDLDLVYRDFAPLDSINQSAGRCNRNGVNGKGIVTLFNSNKAKYIYDATLLHITRTILERYPDSIAESSLYDLNNSYFESIKKEISKDKANTLLKYARTLQMEKLQANFKLIEQDNSRYNVFIPCNAEAIDLWQQYQIILQNPDPFKRKDSLKRLMPAMQQYTTRFPKNSIYTPAPNDKMLPIIYVEDWEIYYDLKTGFKIDKKDEVKLLIV